MLQARKVLEHVYEKVMGAYTSPSSPSSAGAANGYGTGEGADRDSELSSISEEKVELLCQDQVSKTWRGEGEGHHGIQESIAPCIFFCNGDGKNILFPHVNMKIENFRITFLKSNVNCTGIVIILK